MQEVIATKLKGNWGWPRRRPPKAVVPKTSPRRRDLSWYPYQAGLRGSRSLCCYADTCPDCTLQSVFCRDVPSTVNSEGNFGNITCVDSVRGALGALSSGGGMTFQEGNECNETCSKCLASFHTFAQRLLETCPTLVPTVGEVGKRSGFHVFWVPWQPAGECGSNIRTRENGPQ